MGETPLEEPKTLETMPAVISPSFEEGFAENAPRWHPKTKDSSGLVLLASVVTSSIRFASLFNCSVHFTLRVEKPVFFFFFLRGLHFSETKLMVLEILEEISSRLPDELVLDRVIPFIVSFLNP
jgi:hypothetical protein